jgi:hypothetical protein
MVVAADTSPINYVILIEPVDLLKRLKALGKNVSVEVTQA